MMLKLQAQSIARARRLPNSSGDDGLSAVSALPPSKSTLGGTGCAVRPLNSEIEVARLAAEQQQPRRQSGPAAGACSRKRRPTCSCSLEPPLLSSGFAFNSLADQRCSGDYLHSKQAPRRTAHDERRTATCEQVKTNLCWGKQSYKPTGRSLLVGQVCANRALFARACRLRLRLSGSSSSGSARDASRPTLSFSAPYWPIDRVGPPPPPPPL